MVTKMTTTKVNMLACLRCNRLITRAILLLSVSLLVACSGNEYGDLEAYVAEVKSRKSGRIPALPEVKPYETFAYQAHNYRDPFTTYIDEAPAENASNRPDVNRKREALEQFPLDTLSFVGHLEKSGVRWGLISAPDKSVYRVQVGNYIGKNYGEIIAISETAIEIKEVIPDGAGGWVDRKASLSLSE
jgi:type IV pilus assembly protein PilP